MSEEERRKFEERWRRLREYKGQPPGHGGRRAGAGRPPVAADGVRITITISREHAKTLKIFGGGNISLGIRRMVKVIIET